MSEKIDTSGGKTGIEIQVALSPGQRVIGKILETLHLQKLGEWVAGMATAVISVDGEEREEPLYEAHFIEVSPGDHQVSMFMKGPGPTGIQRGFFAAYGSDQKTQDHVTVEAGKVTILEYELKDGQMSSLNYLGIRPA